MSSRCLLTSASSRITQPLNIVIVRAASDSFLNPLNVGPPFCELQQFLFPSPQSPAREYGRASAPSKARSKGCKPVGAPGVGCTPLLANQSRPVLVLSTH